MAYSNKTVENDPSLFPKPQTWLTWIDDIDYEKTNAQARQPGRRSVYVGRGAGKLRHYDTLEAARKSLRWVGSGSKYRDDEVRGKFVVDWSVYHWDDERGEWIEAYSGFAGQERKQNELFRIRFTKGQKAHPIDQRREQRAIESILRELSA